MKKRVFIGSTVLSFLVVAIIYSLFVAIREEAFVKLERIFAHLVRNHISDLRRGIYDGYFCWDEMMEAVSKRDVEFLSSTLPDILRDYPVKGVIVRSGDFLYTVGERLTCPSTPDILWCEGNVVLNMPISDSSGEEDLKDSSAQVILDTGKILESFEEYRVYMGKVEGADVIPGARLHIERPSIMGLRVFAILLALYLTSYGTFWGIISRYTKYVRDESVLLSLVTMLEKRDPYTAGHSRRVARYSREFAKLIGISGGRLKDIYMAGLLHDIGKIGIPERILLKPGPLTDEEYDVIKRHPVISQEILETFEGYERIAKIVRHHHERCDGGGYPDGLTCEEIPFESKIIAIVDVYEALTSDRAYRNRWSVEKALNFIESGAGEIFDEELVGRFIEFIRKKEADSRV